MTWLVVFLRTSANAAQCAPLYPRVRGWRRDDRQVRAVGAYSSGPLLEPAESEVPEFTVETMDAVRRAAADGRQLDIAGHTRNRVGGALRR